MTHTLLQKVEPGLVKLSYSYKGRPIEELALKLPQSFSFAVSLPMMSCVIDFFRESMKAAFPNTGLRPYWSICRL